ASASRITAVIPYFGYARQDRRPRASRVPITAKLVAKLIAAAGFDRVLTVDLHADQIQGFFDIAVDNVYASPLLLGDVWKQKYEHMVVVSPDVGGVVRARALAKRLDGADHREARRQADRRRGLRPRAHGGPARGPDPGLLRHRRRQRLRIAAAARRRLEAEVRAHGGGFPRRRRRGPGPCPREAPRRCR